ncbi:MAG: Uma2 family endonuclease [Gemmatimonadaceae bacterium]|nr:Uma2 family endonuclease [Gemmatimonadaceae bacterium]MCW5826249.1 Uma2 family endonuclease [Gemmatimonadaceae bacterium]
MPALADRYWTAADVRALPDDGNRYECVDGELLVTPAPRGQHQLAIREVFLRLHAYVDAHQLGVFLWSPADIELEADSLVQPDLFVATLRDGVNKFRNWTDVAGLALAIEVLSPSTARYDRVTKRRFYQRAGVAEYWIVDLDARLVERWQPGDASPEILFEQLRWLPEGAAAALEIDLTAFFAAICD